MIKLDDIDTTSSIHSYKQPKTLLDDIRDYVETRQMLYMDYSKVYRKDYGNIYKYWVLYDIYTYIIDNRHYLSDSQLMKNIEIEYIKFEPIKTRKGQTAIKRLSSRINIVWGLLLLNERNNFIIKMREENIIPK